ncbi:phosphatase PAP2 family protein [Sphingomonas sp. HITSZ_GF]|uniref:acid phosphatase n=1 Tax=Sphingomonas sp. HITSZ_GF TaxID=3037247 RepID=UPI00240DDFBB|nr:phosphatase PAP2 family protein [Sphingomonas sp. HITSZ_GF]MDG2534814.1 phosphatase PAP2 family protein [Sphingomonas sp. HITSZ_GF]
MIGRKLRYAVGAVLILGGAAAFSADKPYGGYLTPGEFEVTRVLPPAPIAGDARYESDRAIFRGTRALLTTPRGALATSDVVSSPEALMRDFSCAVGVSLTPENAPKLMHVIRRAGIDTGAQTNIAKNLFKRERPFKIDEGDICESKAELADSYDYPSGHTTRGWTWAMILADLAPDRAQEILKRGRAYGESRFICGAHNQSAVEAGFISASATLTLVRTKPAYRADLAEARAELGALRANPKAAQPTACAAEAALIDQPVTIPAAAGR